MCGCFVGVLSRFVFLGGVLTDSGGFVLAVLGVGSSCCACRAPLPLFPAGQATGRYGPSGISERLIHLWFKFSFGSNARATCTPCPCPC